jgi:hypothetical protein
MKGRVIVPVVAIEFHEGSRTPAQFNREIAAALADKNGR